MISLTAEIRNAYSTPSTVKATIWRVESDDSCIGVLLVRACTGYVDARIIGATCTRHRQVAHSAEDRNATSGFGRISSGSDGPHDAGHDASDLDLVGDDRLVRGVL